MGGTPDLPTGLSTAPGDLPLESVDDAVDLALDGREFPSVPVLPGPISSLLAQAVTPMAGVHVLPTGTLRVDVARFGVRSDLTDDLARDPAAHLGGASATALVRMLQRWPEVAATRADVRALRVDVAGPVTVALALVAAGVPHATALDAARLVGAQRARSIVAAVRAVEPALPLALVMGEPRLVGSMHPTFPLTVRQVRSLLDPVVDALDDASTAEAPVLIGIHVPGRSDWQTIISSGVSMLSMPPDPCVVGWAPSVQALLDNGGWIAWGAVPVDRPLGTSEELLWRQLSATWRDLVAAGVDPAMLRERCMVGPADGLGRFGVEQIAGIRGLVDALGERVRLQVMGTRLGLGA